MVCIYDFRLWKPSLKLLIGSIAMISCMHIPLVGKLSWEGWYIRCDVFPLLMSTYSEAKQFRVTISLQFLENFCYEFSLLDYWFWQLLLEHGEARRVSLWYSFIRQSDIYFLFCTSKIFIWLHMFFVSLSRILSTIWSSTLVVFV